MAKSAVKGTSGYMVGYAQKGGKIHMSKAHHATLATAKKAAKAMHDKYPSARVLVLKSTVKARYGR